MRFIVVTCCALVVVKSASIRDKFIVTPQNFSSPSENFIFSSQKVKIITVPGQVLRPLTQNVGKLKAEEIIYSGLNSIRNKIDGGNEKLNNDFWRGLNNSVQELVIRHKNSDELGSEFQNLMQEKLKNQQGFGQSVINFFTEGVSNIVNSLGGAPPPSPVPSVPQTPQPLDDIDFEETTQKPNFLSNVVNSVQQVFQAPQRPQQAQAPQRPQQVQAPQRPQQAQSQQAQPQAPVQPQPVQPAPTFNQPIQDVPSTQRPNFLSNVVNSVQQAFKPPPQPAQPQQQIQLQVPIQPIVQPLPNNQPIQDAPTTTHRPNFLSNVANSVQQAFKPVQQTQPQQVPIQQAQLQAANQPVQPNNQPLHDATATSTQRPNFLSNVVNSVQQAFQPPSPQQQQQAQPLQTQPEQGEPQQVQIQISIQANQLPSPTESPSTERPGFLSNVVGQVQQTFQRPQQQVTQPPRIQQTQAVEVETSTSPSPGFIQGAINQVVDNFRPVPSTPPLDFIQMPTTTTTTTQSSLLQNIGQAIQGFRPQNRPAPSAPPQILETTYAAATTTLAPNIFQNIGQAIQGLRPQPTQTTTTTTPSPPQPNQVQQVVASSSQVPLSQNNNLQIAIAEVAACIVKTRIDHLVEQSKHKISGEL